MTKLWSKLAQLQRYGQAAVSAKSRPAFWVYGVARHNPFDSSNLVSRLGQLCFPELRLKPKVLGGRSVRVNTSDIGHLISFEEVLIETVYDLSVIPFVPEVVLDCGAHIGLFSALVMAKFPTAEVRMFEPNRRNAAFLNRQLKELPGRVQLIEAAVSTRSGDAWFQGDYSNTGQIADARLPGSEQVALLDAKSLIQPLAGKRVVIKLDIEGEEERVVPAIAPLLPRQCVLFFETHNGAESWTSVAVPLQTEGFAVHSVRSRGQYSDGYAVRSV